MRELEAGAQVLACVGARVVGNAREVPLRPEQVVRELRYAIEVDGVDRSRPAAVEGPERGNHHVADRCERHRRIERLGRVFVVSARPDRAHGQGALAVPL